jgi:hypothetical protein
LIEVYLWSETRGESKLSKAGDVSGGEWHVELN